MTPRLLIQSPHCHSINNCSTLRWWGGKILLTCRLHGFFFFFQMESGNEFSCHRAKGEFVSSHERSPNRNLYAYSRGNTLKVPCKEKQLSSPVTDSLVTKGISVTESCLWVVASLHMVGTVNILVGFQRVLQVLGHYSCIDVYVLWLCTYLLSLTGRLMTSHHLNLFLRTFFLSSRTRQCAKSVHSLLVMSVVISCFKAWLTSCHPQMSKCAPERLSWSHKNLHLRQRSSFELCV